MPTERRIHVLKTWPEPFEAVIEGRKRFDFRFNDRGYAVGDLLVLGCWDPTPTSSTLPRGYTGKWTMAEVTYVAEGLFGIPPNHVVLSITPRPSLETELRHNLSLPTALSRGTFVAIRTGF
jgi:hypothetical protein